MEKGVVMVRISANTPRRRCAVRWSGHLLRTAVLLTLAALWPATAGADAGGADTAAKPAEASDGAYFSGTIADRYGQPIVEAKVEVNGRWTYTRGDGTYQLTVEPDERYLINLSHPDYADYSYLTRSPMKEQNWCLVRAQIEFVDANDEIVLIDKRPELQQSGMRGAVFRLAPGSLIHPKTGERAQGTVRAAIATLDVSNGQGPGDWAMRDGDREGFLVSYGAVFIHFTDPETGESYQLDRGRFGSFTMPVIPSMEEYAFEAPEAPLWYFDTKDGYWKKNGLAVFDPQSRTYIGEVDHLSTINTDIAKFDAACLKVTLDASLSTGNSLRIRYHSGGTPFGQSPTFVMNDVDNAAYRLPANTNVLLEVLNPSNQVLGSVVVEDPPGTPLVNTVVDTGPPIPSGNSLWPPPPFTDCKPVVLRLGMPQVEIRINELTSTTAIHDNPTDDYVTWAPTYSLARLATPSSSAVNVVLTNDPSGSIPGGGNVRFAAHQSPWPINTTATATTLPLTLPASGAWVPFMIAGEFGSPSENDKDAVIEAHLNTSTGPIVGSKALMVRIRKDANTLTSGERDRFLFAWQKLRNALGDNYILFQEMHRLASTAGDEAHMQPAFLTWHRAMLLAVERELQKHEPSVALHYWDWDAAAPNLFTQDFMGESGSGGFVAEPVFSATNPLNGWDTDLPFSGGELRRNTQDHTLDPGSAMKPLDHAVDPDLIAWTDYGPTSLNPFAVNSFSDDVERASHNPAHGWPCGAGHLTNPNRSAADPLFYLLHSQIDRQWAYWQRVHTRFGVPSGSVLTFPAPQHYDNTGAYNTSGNTPDPNFRQKGSYLEDGLWPWDGTTGGTPGTVEWRPVNQATSSGQNIPNSTPLIPMTAFPASPRPNLWPASSTVIENRHVIDYHGRFVLEDGLGFSYDDVPYN